MEKRRHKAVTNELNPRDHNTRGGHTVKEKHRGNVPKPVPKMKTMERAIQPKVKVTKKKDK